MSDLLCNGVPVLSGRLLRPRIGSWSGELVLEAEAAPTGALVLSDGTTGAALFRGAAQRTGLDAGRATVRLVGGAGGLGRALDPRYYRGAPARLVLRDLARETGETLAALDAPELDAPLRAWTRERADGASSLRALAEALGLVWRALPDGTQWVGRETWLDSGATGYEVLRDEPAQARWTLATPTLAEAAAVAPGTLLEERRVSLVEHTIAREGVRTRVSFERADAPLDRLREGFEASVRRATASLRWCALYPARVVAQGADGLLEVIPDDPTLPPLVGLPLRLSIPGSVRVPTGARVLVGFEGAQPSRPYASLWEGAALDEVRLGSGAKRVARAGDTATLQLRVVKSGGNVQSIFVRSSATDAWAAVTDLPDGATSVAAVIQEGASKVLSD